MSERTPYGKAVGILERAGMDHDPIRFRDAKRALLMTAATEGEEAALKQARRIREAWLAWQTLERSLDRV